MMMMAGPTRPGKEKTKKTSSDCYQSSTAIFSNQILLTALNSGCSS